MTLTLNGLENTDDHYFAVTAYDKDFNESINSNVVHSPPNEDEPPAEPPEEVLLELDFMIDVKVLK